MTQWYFETISEGHLPFWLNKTGRRKTGQSHKACFVLGRVVRTIHFLFLEMVCWQVISVLLFLLWVAKRSHHVHESLLARGVHFFHCIGWCWWCVGWVWIMVLLMTWFIDISSYSVMVMFLIHELFYFGCLSAWLTIFSCCVYVGSFKLCWYRWSIPLIVHCFFWTHTYPSVLFKESKVVPNNNLSEKWFPIITYSRIKIEMLYSLLKKVFGII